jgi:uncharacterized protein YdbL (DUF1318 family)
MKNLFLRILFVALTLALPAAATLRAADDLGALKSRMIARVSKVDDAKAKGLIGENNRGLLELRGAGGADIAALVADENKDRSTVYDALAKQTGSTADAVGKARAKQIADGSAPGVWVQKEDGSWVRK